jgi:hypothetical protein
MRHAALWLRLNAGEYPAQITARAGHSVAVLLTVYSHSIHGQDDLPQPADRPDPRALRKTWPVPVRRKASDYTRPRDSAEPSGYIDRATGADAVRHARP